MRQYSHPHNPSFSIAQTIRPIKTLASSRLTPSEKVFIVPFLRTTAPDSPSSCLPSFLVLKVCIRSPGLTRQCSGSNHWAALAPSCTDVEPTTSWDQLLSCTYVEPTTPRIGWNSLRQFIPPAPATCTCSCSISHRFSPVTLNSLGHLWPHLCTHSGLLTSCAHNAPQDKL